MKTNIIQMGDKAKFSVSSPALAPRFRLIRGVQTGVVPPRRANWWPSRSSAKRATALPQTKGSGGLNPPRRGPEEKGRAGVGGKPTPGGPSKAPRGHAGAPPPTEARVEGRRGGSRH